MSNINLGQFLNNFVNNFNRLAAGSVANAMLQNNQVQNEQQTTAQMNTLFPNTTAQLQQTSAELAALNQTQTTNMVKELLNMPKDLQQLISQLTVNGQQVNAKSAFSLLSSSLELSSLSSLLQSSSKEAAVKLYQMVAQYNQLGVSLKDEQLSQITKLISLVSASSASDVQSLRTVMLMYLPWLPLADPNAFKLEISGGGSDGTAIGEDSVTILISTENYGNLQCSLYKTEQDGIKADITVSETFPQKELKLLILEDSKKYSININIDFFVKPAFNKDKNERTETQVCMNSSPGINPFLLVVSGAFIKNVHTVDEKENLRGQRKEKI